MTQGSRIQRAVEAASILELAAALTEPDNDGYGPPLSDDFYCPMCQRGRQWLLSGPSAASAGDLIWRCGNCHAAGTLWQLARMVLEDVDALSRFMAHAQVAA